MPRSYGYWLDPKTGVSHPVTTHQDWVLENAVVIGVEEIVRGMDSKHHEDELRIIACKEGLVRIRDYGLRASIQFWAESSEIAAVIFDAVSRFAVEQEFGEFKWLWINNLFNGDEASMNVQDFLSRTADGARCFSTLAD